MGFMTDPVPPSGDVRMRGFARRSTVAETLAWLDGQTRPLPEQTVPLAEAAGRVLARDVVSRVDVPHFVRAMMDGLRRPRRRHPRGIAVQPAGPGSDRRVDARRRPFAGHVGPRPGRADHDRRPAARRGRRRLARGADVRSRRNGADSCRGRSLARETRRPRRRGHCGGQRGAAGRPGPQAAGRGRALLDRHGPGARDPPAPGADRGDRR